MGRIARCGRFPIVGIKAEEEFNILHSISIVCGLPGSIGTYPHRIGLRAIHVAEKEVSELDSLVESRKPQTPLCSVSPHNEHGG